MPSAAPDVIEKTIRIAARPNTVFAYFTDPDKIAQWHGIEADTQPQPGGLFRVNVTRQMVARGEFLEVHPFTRLVFTWGWEGGNSPVPPGRSTVEVTFTPDGDDTIVQLTHRGLPIETVQGHGDGWDHYLARLQAVARGDDPGPDPWLQSPPS